MTTEFINAQQMQKDHPDSFEAPSLIELAELDKGTFVKVCTGGERFWTEIKEIADDKVTAVINNNLVCTDVHGLQHGDEIKFTLDNIYDIYP